MPVNNQFLSAVEYGGASPGSSVYNPSVGTAAKFSASRHTCVNGKDALSHVAYGVSEVALVYPAVSGDKLDSKLNQYSNNGLPNCFGAACKVSTIDTKVGAGTAVLGSLSTGALSTVVATSQSLTDMLPSMHKLAMDRSSAVFHVAASEVDEQMKETPGYLDIFRSVHTGLGMLHSNSVQECHDLALVAHIASARVSLPFMHFFDNTQSGSEVVKAQLLPYNKLAKVAAHLADKDVRPEIVTKKRIPDVVDDVMAQLRRVLKRRYRLFEYVGNANAELVVVSLCSQTETAALECAVATASASGMRVGLLKVRMLRPWSARHLLQALPLGTLKRCAVVSGQNQEAANVLYSDVVASIPLGHGCQVVSTSFSSAINVTSATSLYDRMSTSNDTSLAFDEVEDAADVPSLRGDIKKVISWDLTASTGAAQSTASLGLDLASLVGENTSLFVHAVQQHDAYNLGGHIVGSHLHIAPSEFATPALALSAPADYVTVHDIKVLDMIDVSSQLKDEGVVLINSPSTTQDEFESTLPANFRRDLATRKLKVFVLDADKAYENVSLSLQLGVLLLTGLLGKSSLAQTVSYIKSSLGVALQNQYVISEQELNALLDSVAKAMAPMNVPDAWVADGLAPAVAAEDVKESENAVAPVVLPTRIVAPSLVRSDKQLEETPRVQQSSWTKSALQLLFPEAYDGKTAHRPQDKEETYVVTVGKNLRVTPNEYDRNVFHMEFDITGTDLKYAIGDALGIYARNREEDVSEFLEMYGLNANDTASIKTKTGVLEVRTAEQIVTQLLDLFGRPSRRFYSALAPFATDEKQKEKLDFLAGKEGGFEFKKRVEQTVTFADLLKEFSSARPTLAELCDIVPEIKPRHYSIASAQSMHPNSVHLLIVLVEWQTPDGKQRYGQATKYLVDLPVGSTVSVCVKPSVMTLPEDPTAPVVMAGLGTGMAPFRAFIQERAMQAAAGIKVGPMSLYFGSRSMFQEYLYGDELEAYNASGLLTNLRCAFSRDGPKKVYIQHRLQDDARQLHEYLESKGQFYLCGPTWPAGDVQDAITAAFERYGGLTNAEAAKAIADMKEHERYILEVY